MRESRDQLTDNLIISKDEFAKLSEFSEEQLDQEEQKIQASNKQSTLSDEAFAEFQKTEREATAAEKFITGISEGLMKEAEKQQQTELLATDKRTEEEKRKQEEEEKKKKKAEDQMEDMEGGDYSIDLKAVLDFMRDKLPEQLAELVHKYSSMMPTSTMVNGINDMSMNQLATMAPFMADFSPITQAIDHMGSRENDKPQTMASLNKLSNDLKNLQSLMEQMSAWNDNPTTDDQKLQNLAILTKMKEQLAAITRPDPNNPEQTALAQTILQRDPNLQNIEQALSAKIDKELAKVDDSIKKRYEQGELPPSHTKTPDQIAKKLGDLAKQINFPAGRISLGLRFASMKQVAKAAKSFAKSLSNISSFLDKAREKCDGNADTMREFDKLSKSLQDTRGLLYKLSDEKDGWKSNPKGDDVRHNYALLQHMKKQLDDIENNPLMKNTSALKDVQKVTKALRNKIKKELATLEEQDPSLKTQPIVIAPTKESYDCDKGRLGDRYTRDHLSLTEFKNDHDLTTSQDRECIRFSAQNEIKFEFNRETREIILLNEDEASAALAIEFAQKVLQNEELRVTATADNMSMIQHAFKEADLTATFKETHIPTASPAPTVTQEQTQELKKEVEEEEKSDLSSPMSMKPGGP